MLELTGHSKDLGGGFTVRRLLPSAQRQSVGPFLFVDHFGPVEEAAGRSHDVRPHPHIGLATVTYLFEGAMLHRDSLGSVERIEPGAINWMTSGRGIVHSERKPDDLLATPFVNHGLQLWVGLPREHEEAAPAFSHTAASAIPEVTVSGVRVRVLVGQAFDAQSPVATFAETLYLDIHLPAGGRIALPSLADELAFYAVGGGVRVDGEPLAERTMGIPAEARREIVVEGGEQPVRLMVLGGAPLDGHRFMWWNFVSSRRERILEAAAEWRAGGFERVPGDEEFIPAPDVDLR